MGHNEILILRKIIKYEPVAYGMQIYDSHRCRDRPLAAVRAQVYRCNAASPKRSPTPWAAHHHRSAAGR